MFKNGFVGGYYFPSPSTLDVVWNLKTKATMIEYLKTNVNPFRLTEQVYLDFEKVRFLPGEISYWVTQEWRKNGIKSPKRDAWGVPGGQIEQIDFDAAALLGQPEKYAEFSIIRETKEESGRIIVREVAGVRKVLFESFAVFYEKDRLNPKERYENNFFWVRDADGELKKEGFKDETEAPEIVSIFRLRPSNFYPKHAHALHTLLVHMVYNLGMQEYRPALNHIESTFDPYPNWVEEAGTGEPVLNLSDDALWESFTSQPSIKPLRK